MRRSLFRLVVLAMLASTLQLAGPEAVALVAATRPDPPRGVRAGAGDGAAIVTWQAPANGGAAITYYVITAFPGGRTVMVSGDATVAGMTGLTNGEEYTFTVMAINAVGASDASAPSQPVTPAVARSPGAPLVTDTYPRDSAVRVGWSPPEIGTETVTGYVVRTSPGGVAVTVPRTATEAVVTGLTNGTRYTFTVTATNAVGSGVSLPSRPVAPEPARVPQRPPMTQVIALNQRIDVQWSAPVDGGASITGYTVTAQPGNHTRQIPADTTVASLTGLANGTAYSVSVTAANRAGRSEPATRTDVRPVAARAPQPPTDIQAAVSVTGSVEVSWTAPVDTGTGPITGYAIQASPGGASTIAAATARKATISGLDPATGYSFTVRAGNAAGIGATSSATEPLLPRLSVRKTPKVLSPGAVATLRQVHRDGTLEFEQPPTEVTALVADDLVILRPGTSAPRGLYRKVTAVSRQSGLFIVSTAPAALTEALGDGAFSVDSAIDTADVASFTPLSPGVSLSRPTIGRMARDGADVTLRDGSLVLTIADDVPIADGANTGRFEVTLALTPDADVSGGISVTGNVNTKSEFSLTYQAEARGQLGPLTWTKEWPIAKISHRCWTVTVGPVPVVLCLELELKVKLTVTAGGGVSFDVAYGREIGVEIRTQNSSVSVDTINRAVDNDPPDVRAFGAFGARLGLPVQPSLYVYDLIGPGFKAEPWVDGQLDTRADPCWTIKVGIKVDAFFRSREILGHQIDWTSEGIIDESVVIADSGGPCTGIRVLPEQATTAPGQAVQFRVEYLGNVPVTSIAWRIVSGPGTIDHTGRYIHAGAGAAVVEATRPREGIIHPEYKARASVLVGTPPPGPPTITKAEPGPFLARVSWAPPPLPPGQTITRYAVVTDPPTRTTYVPGDQTTAHATGLTAGQSYHVQVYAISGTVTGSPSDWAGPVTAADALGRVGSPSNLAVDAFGNEDNTGRAGISPSAISGNGRYLFFFTTTRSNLAPPEIYNPVLSSPYMLRKDLRTGDIVVASRGVDGRPTVAVSGLPPAPSFDGTKVAFAGTVEGGQGVLIHDLSTGQTRAVYRIGTLSPNFSTFDLSDDARVVSFKQRDFNGDTGWHLYRQVAAGPIQRVDNCFVGSECDAGDAGEMAHDMSGDGSKIIYVEEPADGSNHALLYDSGTTRDLSPGLSGVQYVYLLALSGDGSTWAARYDVPPYSGVLLKRISAGPPTPGDLIVYHNYLPATPEALSRDGNVLVYHFGSNRQGFIHRFGSGSQRLPGPHARYGEWMMDISDDGRIVTWHDACDLPSCPIRGMRLG